MLSSIFILKEGEEVNPGINPDGWSLTRTLSILKCSPRFVIKQARCPIDQAVCCLLLGAV
jgi:hypothetical protein